MRTETAVRDAAGSEAQRQSEYRRGNEMTVSLAVAAQALAYGALYILPTASSAAWWAVLLLLLPAGLMRALAHAVCRTAPENAAETPAYRIAAGGMSLLFLLNMTVCLLTLTELTHAFFFPQASRWAVALAAAAALGLGMPRSDVAAPNAARFLAVFLLAAFGFCAVTVLPSGETGYLFPLAGYGVGHTLRCALRGAGSVWMIGALAVLTSGQKAAPPVRSALPGLLSLVAISLLFLCCAYVLPGTQLDFSRGYALRMQILMEMSPNVLSWSLMLMAEMLLYLAGFTVCGDLLRRSLRIALRRPHVPLLPFALLAVPPAVRGMGAWEALLTDLLPWRYPAAAVMMGVCLAGNRRRKMNNE